MSKKIGYYLAAAAILVFAAVFIGNKLFANPQSPLAITQQEQTVHWKKDQPFKVAAWSPYWAGESSLESIKMNGNKLTNLLPTWYEARENGDINNRSPQESEEIIKQAGIYGLEITATVTLFDHEILSSILNNPEYLNNHVNKLLALADPKEIDGIDIDYESTKLADKEQFFELIQRLSTGLKAKNKKLSVTVLPKWSDTIQYPGLRETRQVQDWSRIAELADEVRIMTYDYTGQGSPQIGPIAPLNWQEEVIQYGLTKVPKEKLILGIPLYAYEKWVEVENESQKNDFSAPSLQFQPDLFKNGGPNTEGRAYTYTQISKVISTADGKTEDYQGEKIFRYSKVNDSTKKLENRVMVYTDPIGIKQKIDLAKKYELKGVSFWSLGGEKELLEKLGEVKK
jgi:spore germination protein YaaH